MVLPIIGKFTWGAFGLGAATAAVSTVVFRPLLVETVRVGYEATDLVKDTWTKAKTEAESIKADALTKQTASNTEAEIRQLREEVAALRAQAKRG